MTQLRNVNIKTQDSFAIDAFGRLRVSNPATLFDSKNIFDDNGLGSAFENQPLFFDNQNISGSGTSTQYRVNESSQRLTVSSAAGARVRQSKQRFNYQSGKSQLCMVTFNLISLDANIRKRVGYFDDNNGLFLETSSSDVYLVRRTSTSGSPVDSQVAQASWNIDPFDGTGPSGITLDLTKTQILLTDFEWLGVGRVRMGFVIDGIIYYAHEFLSANNLTVVYMKSPNLPIRYEIENLGGGSTSSLDSICSTVISEGGTQDRGVDRYASTTTLVDANAAGTVYAVVGLKLKTEYIGATIKILQTNLLEVQGSKNLEWLLILNPDVAGTFTYSNVINSAVQVAYGATANEVTNGTIVDGGFFISSQGKTGGASETEITNQLSIGSTIDGTPDEIILCVKPLAGSTNTDVYGAIKWRELV